MLDSAPQDTLPRFSQQFSRREFGRAQIWPVLLPRANYVMCLCKYVYKHLLYLYIYGTDQRKNGGSNRQENADLQYIRRTSYFCFVALLRRNRRNSEWQIKKRNEPGRRRHRALPRTVTVSTPILHFSLYARHAF